MSWAEAARVERTLLLGLKQLFRREPKPRRWEDRAEDLPWFDRPGALETLEGWRAEGKRDAGQCDGLKNWVEEGYFVAEGLIDADRIDRMQADIEAIWEAGEPTEHLEILGVPIRPGAEAGFHHWQLLELPRAERERLRDTENWRLHGFNRFSAATQEIYEDPKLKALASMIFDRPAENETTINFRQGSRQHIHQDMAVFHISPRNYLAGAWIACEDVHPDSGPLVYYPGSHRAPMYPKFDNYPQTNLRTANPAASEGYDRYMDELCGKYEKKAFLAKKGDVLLWHGMLLHGGDGVKDPARTRKSLVIHYIPQGMNRHEEIVGPVNW